MPKPAKKVAARKPVAKKAVAKKPARKVVSRKKVAVPPVAPAKPAYKPTLTHAPFGLALGTLLVAVLGILAAVVSGRIAF